MFGTGYPQPPHRREVAMLVNRQESRAIASTELTVDLPDNPRAATPPPDLPIRFSVSYTLGEYLSMVREHIAFLMRHEARDARRRYARWAAALGLAAGVAGACALAGAPGWTGILAWLLGLLALGCLPVTANVWIALLCPPVFYLKKRRMPVCEFVIDREGIERTSRLGVLRRGWGEVVQVRRYSQGYLVAFARGAVPIPFRCLDAGQRERFRAFSLARREATRAA
jgi:hypothetical protein